MSIFPLLRARRAWPVLASAVTVAALGAATPASAVPAPAGPSPHLSQHFIPTREAARAGVAPGNAPMGWRQGSTVSAQSTTVSAAAASGVNGMDVASWQRTVDWKSWKAKGKSFAYVKATEGTSYTNPYFSSQYTGSANVGMTRGAYHFGIPNGKSGSAQASYFVAHGGGWSRDGRTLPGVLDVEYNPYGSTCYGLSQASMVSWIKSFTTRYKALTSRDAVIYTTTDWWTRCTGNSKSFNRTNPLWIARYASSVGTLPGGWTFYTFWQYTSSPLDQDRFSGARSRLTVLANG
jgi:GH25 family lysozyme M1 (1,4-beta-N-acetylmuramidase)